MLVYRVELPNGRGPYWGTSGHPDPLFNERLALHHTDAAHPPPDEDGIPSYGSEAAFGTDGVCGFESLSAMYAWFDDSMQELERLNFQISVYEAATVVTGGKQLVFGRSTATKLKTYKLSEIFGVDHIRQIDYGWDGYNEYWFGYEYGEEDVDS